MKLFVIGHEETVLGFSLIGVEGFSTDDPVAARQKLDELMAERDVGLILITAGLARRLEARLQEIERDTTLPIVLRVPAPGEPLDRPPVRELVRRSLGAGL